MTTNQEDDRRHIFLAAPFAGWLDSGTGLLAAPHKDLLTSLITRLEADGRTVYNAHKREQWGGAWMGPAECTPLDYRAIVEATALVAILGPPESGGVHVELGWASAHRVPVVLLLRRGVTYSSLVLGLGEVGPCEQIWWDTPEECVSLLSDALRTMAPTTGPALHIGS